MTFKDDSNRDDQPTDGSAGAPKAKATAAHAPKLPNLTFPDIRKVRAELFDIDITEDRQRDPELRKARLVKQFGEEGEKFDFEKFEIITALPRPNGRFFPSRGMGRTWAVLNLLKRPDLELPVIVLRAQGDQAEKMDFAQSQISQTPITSAQLFMTYGHMTGKRFAEHRAIVDELDDMALTTVPGNGAKTLTVTSAIFAGRLGQLRRSYNLARSWWYKDQFKSGEFAGQWKYKVEGTALSALAAWCYTFDGDKRVDWGRCVKAFDGLHFDNYTDEKGKEQPGLKTIARTNFLTDTASQGRDDAPAIFRQMVAVYNKGLSAEKKLDWRDAHAIRDDFAKDPFFKEMHDTWRMFDPGERDKGE